MGYFPAFLTGGYLNMIGLFYDKKLISLIFAYNNLKSHQVL